MMVLWIVLALVVLIVVWLVAMYNGLITRKNRVEEASSDIDVQLKRRYELIPNLVNTVKGYAAHESGVFEKVTELRAGLLTGTTAEKIATSNQLTESLKSLFAVAENYPDLKANQNVMSLQEELTATENKISFARQFYNDTVLTYNNKIQMFPSNVIAGMFNFTSRQFFEAPEGDREVPKVDLR